MKRLKEALRRNKTIGIAVTLDEYYEICKRANDLEISVSEYSLDKVLLPQNTFSKGGNIEETDALKKQRDELHTQHIKDVKLIDELNASRISETDKLKKAEAILKAVKEELELLKSKSKIDGKTEAFYQEQIRELTNNFNNIEVANEQLRKNIDELSKTTKLNEKEKAELLIHQRLMREIQEHMKDEFGVNSRGKTDSSKLSDFEFIFKSAYKKIHEPTKK